MVGCVPFSRRAAPPWWVTHPLPARNTPSRAKTHIEKIVEIALRDGAMAIEREVARATPLRTGQRGRRSSVDCPRVYPDRSRPGHTLHRQESRPRGVRHCCIRTLAVVNSVPQIDVSSPAHRHDSGPCCNPSTGAEQARALPPGLGIRLSSKILGRIASIPPDIRHANKPLQAIARVFFQQFQFCLICLIITSFTPKKAGTRADLARNRSGPSDHTDRWIASRFGRRNPSSGRPVLRGVGARWRRPPGASKPIATPLGPSASAPARRSSARDGR
jgi:hypothetical protein